MYVSAVISYSLAYDDTDDMDRDNFATALSAYIQISIVLKGMVRKTSKEPIVLAKTWVITPEKGQKTIKGTTQ